MLAAVEDECVVVQDGCVAAAGWWASGSGWDGWMRPCVGVEVVEIEVVVEASFTRRATKDEDGREVWNVRAVEMDTTAKRKRVRSECR